MKVLIIVASAFMFLSCGKQATTNAPEIRNNEKVPVDVSEPNENPLLTASEITTIKKQLLTNPGSFLIHKAEPKNKAFIAGAALARAFYNQNIQIEWNDLDEKQTKNLLAHFFDEQLNLKK